VLNREVDVWRRLNHPNVAELFGVSYHIGGRPAIITRWYENTNASKYTRTINRDANKLVLVGIHSSVITQTLLMYLLPKIMDVAQGFKYLHTSVPPIVHGDLKAVRI
jgi:hypothetical protein